MSASTVPSSRWRRRPGAVLAALALIALTLAIATALRPVGLAEVLLIVLVEVVGVSLLAGRAVAALTAVGAVLAVNLLLVPPYGTLAIAQSANWVTLAVFLLLSVGVSTLVESALASERRAASAAARATALAEVLRPQDATAAGALEVVRTALQLDAAALADNSAGADPTALLVVTPEPAPGIPPSAEPPSLVVDVPPGFQVRGWGPEILGGRPDYVTALATAVVRAWESEQLAAEQERSARLAELDAARAALLATIGHDLRTPLSGIRISADALAMAGDNLSEEDRQALLDGLRQSAVRLEGLLSAVLDAARIEAGVASPAPQRLDLRDVIGRAIGDFASDRIRLALPAEPVPATTDPVLLERIIGNLVGNALAHTPDDSPVELDCGASPDCGPTVRVVDHGAGLSPDAIDVGRNQHGMGLLIVDRLAGLAGVEVTRSETPGGGLTVTLRIGGSG